MNNRGFHPFDYESASQYECSSDFLSSFEDSQHIRPSQCSQFSMQKEVQTKRRIMDGAIDFHKDPWGTMPDGASESLLACLIAFVSTIRLPNVTFAP